MWLLHNSAQDVMDLAACQMMGDFGQMVTRIGITLLSF